MADDKRTGIVPFASRYTSWSQQAVVEVHVSRDGTRNCIHAFKLKEHSPSFLDLIKGGPKEEHNQDGEAIVLEHVDAETMDIVSNWLYTGHLSKVESVVEQAELYELETEAKQGSEDAPSERTESMSARIPTPDETENRHFTPASTASGSDNKDALTPVSETPTKASADVSTTTITASNLEYLDIFRVYAFAVKYDFPLLKLEALKCWQRRSLVCRKLPGTALIDEIFDVIPEDVQLTRMVALQYAKSWTSKKLPESMEKTQAKLDGLHRNFLPMAIHYQQIILMRAAQNKTLGETWCDFHGHGSEEERQACFMRRVAEKEENELRKRKGCLKENDLLKKRIRKHHAHLSDFRVDKPAKQVISLELDEDGLIIEGPKKQGR